MKRIFIFSFIIFFLFACKHEEVTLPTTPSTDVSSQYVNKWIYDNMSQLYYWNTTLPTYKSSDSNPSDYFKTLKNKDDRFSAIFQNYQDIVNQLNGVSTADIGFEFQLYTESESNNNLLGQIFYFKRGTPAEKLGIARGTIFRKINGQQLTTTNYNKLLNYFSDNSNSATVTFSSYQNGLFIDNPVATTIAKVSNYKEDPVFLDTVYTVQNKKIGYLVYNFFTNDAGDNSKKYDLELNSVIGDFKSQNVTELIIDLRYNHGGMMTSANNFASMLVPNLAADKVFSYTEYNNNFTNYFNSSDYKSQSNVNPFVSNFSMSIKPTYPTSTSIPIQNIGNNLQRIFFLTGKGTASASEMVINGLKPFLPCVLIGDTTVGKNVGSILVNDEDNPKNLWAFMPIVLKYFNKDHQSDFTKGFVPNFLVKDYYQNQLGDINEVLLATAIGQITGLKVNASKAPSIERTRFRSSVGLKPIHDVLIVDSKLLMGIRNRK
jgi:carboxyl-terminal processing protease